MAHDVFISYSSQDKSIADAVCARLESRGIRCWIAPRDVLPGKVWGESIIDAIHESRLMVLVLSGNANNSDHIPKEVERAVNKGLPVLPFRIEEVRPAKSLDYFLSNVHWLDAVTPPLDAHLDELASTVLKLLPGISANQQQKIPPPAPKPIPPVPLPHPVPSPVPPPKPGLNLLVLIGIPLILIGVALGWYLTRGGGGGGSASVSSDPIVGCWTWPNSVAVRILSNGSMTAGPFTAHWRTNSSQPGSYAFVWPEAVDVVNISADNFRMTGGNQYGFPVNATRLTPGSSIVGTWRWINGVPIVFRSDGVVSAGPISARWRRGSSGPQSYEIIWPNPTDQMTLSADHNHLQGGNQYGITLSATRAPTCAD